MKRERLIRRPQDDFSWTTGGEQSILHIAKIASSTFGEVHKMRNDTTKEVFARKLIRPFSTITIEDVANEVRAVTKLCCKGHVNIVQVRSHDWLSGSLYYAIDLEYCELTLAEYIREKRKSANHMQANGHERVLKWRNICGIMINIINGVAFIHNCNEIHRDLKPSNILFSKYTKSWKIGGFGFGAEGSSKYIINSTMSKGSTSYRAPEILNGQPLFTRKVDIWAIGCIFYELVTGEKAFLSDWKVREYGISKSELDLPNLNYHYGASSAFFAFRLRETLKKNWSQRPSAQELLGSFQNFDVYLFYFEHQASTVRKIDVDANATFKLAAEPSAGFSDAIEEVEESKEDSLTLDDIYQRIDTIHQDTELNGQQIQAVDVERNAHERQIHVDTPTRKRKIGKNMHARNEGPSCNSCSELKRKCDCDDFQLSGNYCRKRRLQNFVKFSARLALNPAQPGAYAETPSPNSHNSTASITTPSNAESLTTPNNDPELSPPTPRLPDASCILLMSMHNYIRSQQINQKAKLKNCTPIDGEANRA